MKWRMGSSGKRPLPTREDWVPELSVHVCPLGVLRTPGKDWHLTLWGILMPLYGPEGDLSPVLQS